MFDKNVSLAIKNLRLPLALLIILGHSDILHFPPSSGGEYILFDYVALHYPIAYLCRVLFAPANAMFFMFSGLLFFGFSDKFDWLTYKAKIHKRAKTLFVPYMLWQLIFIIRNFVISFAKHNEQDVWYYLQCFWCVPQTTCPADPPLWFLRDLMICMLLSPVFYWIIKRLWAAIPVFGFIYFNWLFDLSLYPEIPGFSSLGIVFFSIGAAVSIWKVELNWVFENTGKLFFMGFLILSVAVCATTSYHIEPGKPIEVICNMPLTNTLQLIALIAYPFLAVKFSKAFTKFDLGGSFVVYASHWMILDIINKVIALLCPHEISILMAVLLFVVRVTVAFLVGIVLSRLFSKNARLLSLMSGGRV